MRMELNQGTETKVPNLPEPVKQEMKLAQDLNFSVLKKLDNGGWELELDFENETMDVLQGGEFHDGFVTGSRKIDRIDGCVSRQIKRKNSLSGSGSPRSREKIDLYGVGLSCGNNKRCSGGKCKIRSVRTYDIRGGNSYRQIVWIGHKDIKFGIVTNHRCGPGDVIRVWRECRNRFDVTDKNNDMRTRSRSNDERIGIVTIG